jgi:hypothetical protein
LKILGLLVPHSPGDVEAETTPKPKNLLPILFPRMATVFLKLLYKDPGLRRYRDQNPPRFSPFPP